MERAIGIDPTVRHRMLTKRFFQFDPDNPDLYEKVQLEFVLSATNWKSVFLGTFFLNLLIVLIFNQFIDQSSLWIWFSLVLISICLQCGLFVYLEQYLRSEKIPSWWSYSTLVNSAVGGAIWISIPWWLTSEILPTQYIAAFIGMCLVVVASFNGVSHSLLIANLVPRLLIIPSFFIYQAGEVLVAIACLIVIICSCLNESKLIGTKLNILILRHKAEDLTKQLQIEKLNSEAAAYERAVLAERQRLFIDVHDGLGASLTTTYLSLDNGLISVGEAAVLVRGCIDDLRLIIESLDVNNNDAMTLLASMRGHWLSRLKSLKIEMTWDVDDLSNEVLFTPSESLNFIRIIQEAIANVMKHAQATQIKLSAREIDDSIEIIIQDNGVGFNMDDIQIGKGLKNQQYRANLLNGDIRIKSQLPGTQLIFRFPVK
jgi:signal transduction histidine kinase